MEDYNVQRRDTKDGSEWECVYRKVLEQDAVAEVDRRNKDEESWTDKSEYRMTPTVAECPCAVCLARVKALRDARAKRDERVLKAIDKLETQMKGKGFSAARRNQLIDEEIGRVDAKIRAEKQVEKTQKTKDS